MELYLVAIETESGKDRLEPVWVRKTSGAQLQRKEDVAEALEIVRSRQLTPTGAIYPAKDLMPTLEEAKQELKGTDRQLSHVFSHLNSSEAGHEYLLSEEGQQRNGRLEQRFENITELVTTYIDEILPHNSKAALAIVLETSIPTLHRMLSTVDVNAKRSVSWTLMARMFEEMGVLEDLEDALKSRVKQLKGRREAFLLGKPIGKRYSDVG